MTDTTESAGYQESLYCERRPRRELADYVQAVWYQSVTSLLRAAYQQRVVPDGSVDLLWRDGRLAVAGPDSAWRVEDLPPGGLLVGVRFRPGAAGLLFGKVPLDEARDRELECTDLWQPAQVARLTERLSGVSDPTAVARLLESALCARLAHADPPDPVVVAAVRELSQPRQVGDIAARLGFSERQLRRRFVPAVGYGPKTLQSVLRLRRAMRMLHGADLDGNDGASDIAVAAGYADQPHMTREMRRLAGITPRAVLAGT